jgi:phosphoribosylanthranilate isomerase
VRFEVCCIQPVAEARMAIRHGASALGLFSEMPSGPGVIAERRIRAITRCVPPPVSCFLRTEAEGIIGQVRYRGALGGA